MSLYYDYGRRYKKMPAAALLVGAGWCCSSPACAAAGAGEVRGQTVTETFKTPSHPARPAAF